VDKTVTRRKTTHETFAERLVRIRKSRGLTQVEVAAITRISPRMIAHYETKIQNPAPETVVRLAKALNISVDELFGHTSAPKEDIIKNRKLFKKMKVAESLPPHAQKTVMDLIDGLETKHAGRKNKTDIQGAP
jgi:transcriptional regulator with XRE-family HTH domain